MCVKNWFAYISPPIYALFIAIFFTFPVFSKNPLNKQTDSPDLLLKQGLEFNQKGQFKQAVVVFEKAVMMVEKRNRPELMIVIYNNLANSLSFLNRQNEAIHYYIVALKISKRIKKPELSIGILNNIGTILETQNNFPKALSYYKEALVLYNKSHLIKPEIKGDCYNNIAVILDQQGNYSDAIQNYNEALLLYKEVENKQKIGIALNNIAIVYKYLKQFNNSIRYYRQSIAISIQLKDSFLLAANYNNIGNVFTEIKKYSEALEAGFLANSIAKKIGSKEIVAESYDGIATAYECMNNVNKALEYRKLYEREKFEILDLEKSNQINRLNIKYETSEKENKILQLQNQEKISQLENSRQRILVKTQRYFLIIGIVIVLLVMISIYFYSKKEKRLVEEMRYIEIMEAEEKERVRIAQDIHDDMGIGLSKIRFITHEIARSQSIQTETLSEIRSINQTAEGLISSLRDLIWVLPPMNNTMGNFLNRIREFMEDCFYATRIKASMLNMNDETDFVEMKMDYAVVRNLQYIIKEIMHNTIKHSNATLFHIHVGYSDNILSIRTKDDGQGFDTAKYSLGNGLANINRRIHSIGGSVVMESGAGTSYEIQVNIVNKNNLT